MKQNINSLILRSLIFYRKSSVYQSVIVFLLAAIITGSLLTGFSVRESLKTTASEHLGNVDILISSGLRYFNRSLSERISQNTGEKCVSLLEMDGYCQNFATGSTSLNTVFYGITTDFFSFQGNDSIIIPQGSVALNKNLAQDLDIDIGDQIIIHYREISPIPANAPFATTEAAGIFKVLKVSQILNPEQSGNFSLGISQIIPKNVFINMSDLTADTLTLTKANRLLIENSKNTSIDNLENILKNSIYPSDIGLELRRTASTGGTEIISERIFIDQEIIEEVRAVIPSAEPVITYLANNISKNGKSTPYSFVAAIPGSIYPEIRSGNRITINHWLASDLNAIVNDTVRMSWYKPMTDGKLEEINNNFIIGRIVGIDSIWGDATLMPEFPGIAGKSSCSEWDAGVPVNMKLIRDKDEDYWNKYKGTPKVFMEYSEGKKLWGSNFGPATAIRFPDTISQNEIETLLKGSFNPEKTGFTINDVRTEAIKAAAESVDFSTLFLSLGFFIILSCIILLALSVSLFFDSRKEQVGTFFALGFTDKWIEKLLFLETFVIALIGAVPGVFTGVFINWLIINALNSVWSGAVQTNTLGSYFSATSLITGFVITITICLILLRIKTRQYLKKLKNPRTGIYTRHKTRRNLVFLIISIVLTVFLLVHSFFIKDSSTTFSFASGAVLFATLVLAVRHFYIGGFNKGANILSDRKTLSRSYYSFNPSHAITPIIIIAAGIFAVFITGVNRLEISDNMNETSGGTGGFLLWGESAVPIKENLNIESAREEFGLDEENLNNLSFVQAKKSPGNDASCLNLNHIKAPPLLGVDPTTFIDKGSFSFATVMKGSNKENPWKIIEKASVNNTIFGIADQTVLEWGLKISPGDTLVLKAENGEPLNIIIAAGLKSSVFQGLIVIGADNFDRYYPSVPGSSIFLATGDQALTVTYQNFLKERLSNYGISVVPAIDRLASFFEVTNTYLAVFTILGAFGMVLGVFGLGFILLRNYNQRKREFAAMAAMGYSIRSLRRMILRDQIQILVAGLFIGSVSAIMATIPSIVNGSEIPWLFLLSMSLSIFIAGFISLTISISTIRNDSLISNLRKEQ